MIDWDLHVVRSVNDEHWRLDRGDRVNVGENVEKVRPLDVAANDAQSRRKGRVRNGARDGANTRDVNGGTAAKRLAISGARGWSKEQIGQESRQLGEAPGAEWWTYAMMLSDGMPRVLVR